jgi:hypothetical protein
VVRVCVGVSARACLSEVSAMVFPKISRGYKKKRKESAKGKNEKPVTFNKGLLYIKKVLKGSKLKCLKKQAALALKAGKQYFGTRKVKIPTSFRVKKLDGGFLLPILTGLSAAAGLVGGISTLIANIKRINTDKRLLELEQNKNSMLEHFFYQNANKGNNKQRGSGFFIKKGKNGYLMKLKCAKKQGKSC